MSKAIMGNRGQLAILVMTYYLFINTTQFKWHIEFWNMKYKSNKLWRVWQNESK